MSVMLVRNGLLGLREKYFFPSQNIIDQINVPNGLLTSMTFVDDGDLLISVRNPNQFFRFDKTNNTVKSDFNIGYDDFPRGIAYDGENLISAPLGRKIYIHEGISSTIKTEIQTNILISALTLANGNLILSNTSQDIVYEMDGISKNVKRRFSFENLTSLCFDTKNLIGGDNQIIRVFHNISNNILSTINPPDGGVTALAHNGKNLISGYFASDIISVHGVKE